LNAIYFKGTWAHQFRKDLTFRKGFNHAGETEEMTYCDMMQQTTKFAYTETDDVQALQMPYGNGSFAMTILLPKMVEGKPSNRLPSVPTGDEWRLLNKQMSLVKVDVKLPRFEINTDTDLIPIMQKLGMTKAFTLEADFQNFCNEPTFISLMKQSARIKVNEEGTEAAAVTTTGLQASSVPILFQANHPFLYVISEQQTGTVLFIGQYTGY
jgi:serpin B